LLFDILPSLKEGIFMATELLAEQDHMKNLSSGVRRKDWSRECITKFLALQNPLTKYFDAMVQAKRELTDPIEFLQKNYVLTPIKDYFFSK